ncbi:MAG: PAS domain-containing protein [Hydrogenophaga sp.]|uniref:PAS domain-containing sensor histidine kinase n=1 Tax=Hydrogenophaga sp. TaxID=1904254 RepID=UPI00257E7934|nr:PAS domain-containing protein [Hydrogenophaga sp.]MBL0945071.1 PAS domain-containing protein [Hydrogenophaga sp.]
MTPAAQEPTPAASADAAADALLALGQQAPCGLLALDAGLRVRALNDTLLDWLGRDRAELERLTGHSGWADFPTLARLNAESDLQQLRAHLHALQTSDKAPPLQLRLFGKDGGFFTVELLSQAERDPQGRFLHSRTVVVDVSARQKIEHQIVARLRLLQTITDRTPSRLAYFDKDLVCRFCNAAYAEGYGLTADDVIGAELGRLLAPEVLPEVLPRVARVLNGEALSHEAERRDANDQPHYHEVHYLPDLQDGRTQGFFIELIDITERRRTEDFVFNANLDLEERVAQRSAELYASEQRFRLMSQAIRDHAIFFLDPDGAVHEWTDSAQRLHGFERGHILGRALDAVFQPEADGQPQDPQELLDRCVEQGHAEQQGWSLRRDGSRFWSNATLTALHDDKDGLQGLSVIVRDLTEHKRLADMTAQLHRELEQRVAQRTAQLDAAHRDLDAFSYTVAHDLRAPLRHIGQYVALTQEVLEPEARHELLQHQAAIAAATRRMGLMIDGLLEFTRLGRVRIDRVPVSLSPLLHGMVNRLRGEVAPREIEWVIDTGLPLVMGDPILLAEVFDKLLDNATKFTRRVPQARIEIGQLPDTDPEHHVLFVRDNGVGFDPSKARSLFLLFQRQHHSMDYEGIGLGLALAHRIVSRHGGRLWCETAPGEGCTFFIELPRATVDTPANDASA